MAFLPPTPLSLKGGCFCSAVRYTISIPALEERPLIPGCPPTPIHRSTAFSIPKDASAAEVELVDTRFPVIELDHCHSCRRVCGSLLQCWLICELKWVTFKLLHRDANISSIGSVADKNEELQVYPTSNVLKPGKELQEATYIGHYSSNGKSERTFCTRCGTPLTFHYAGDRGPEWKLDALVDIAVGTLDQESLEQQGLRPERHGWWEDGTDWVRQMMYKGTGPLIRHPTGRPTISLEEDKHLLEAEPNQQA